MIKQTMITLFILIMFTQEVFGMELVKQSPLPAKILELTQQNPNTSIRTAELYWEKCGDLSVRTYLKIKKGKEKGKEIPIALMNVGWDAIKNKSQELNRFSIEVAHNSQETERFTICLLEIRDPEKMPNRGHFTYKLSKASSVKEKKEDTCIQKTDRLCTYFVYKHENKIAIAIASLALFLLYKYHSCLFFGVSH